MIIWVLLLASLVASLAAPAEEWSRFRGPNGSGISPDKGYPVEFGPSKNLLWRVKVRAGKSSPVLTATRIFLTGSEKDTLYTQCLDRATGKLLWERSEPLTRHDGVNELNHAAAITPVTDGENVYVFFKDFGLISYDPAGKVRWRVPLGPFTATMGLGASPILAGDLLILQVDQLDHSYIAAYSRRDGELRWKSARDESESWGTPMLHQVSGKPAQIITVGAGQFGAHQVMDGKRTFSFAGASPAMVASPVMDGDTVYGFGYGAPSAYPYAKVLERSDKNKDGVLTPDEYGDNAVLNAIGKYVGNRDGVVTEEKWKFWCDHVGGATGLVALKLEQSQDGRIEPRQLWRFDRGFEGVIPSPIVFEGVVYVVKNGGILTASDAKTGERGKTGRITGALGGYSASPVLADGRLYLASEEGKIAVVKPGREWEVMQVNDVGEELFATPALSGGRIFARSNETLYCFGVAPSR